MISLSEERPVPMDEVVCERLSQNQHITNVSQIALLNSDHFENLNVFCPECGSAKYVKNGFYNRNPKLGEFGKITIYIQRYKCKKCGKGFSAKLKGIVEEGHWYAEVFREMVNAVPVVSS